MMEYRQYIGGDWTQAVQGGNWELVNPATEEIIDLIPFGDAADAESAVAAAADAGPSWAEATAYERAAILTRAADLIESRADRFSLVTTEESGKPLAQSKAEWLACPNYFRWAAEEAKRIYGRWIPSRVATRRIDVTYRPVGIVGLITAWNFPVYNQARAISSALAAGCTMVSRPSEYTPRSAMLIAACLEEAGLPPGVLNVINGEAHPMGQVFLDDPRVRKISFTGSTRVGKLLMDGASRTVTRLALEMGGNAPVLIFPDVGEVGRLAADGIAAKVRNAGQVCVSPQRFYVHRELAEDFAEQAVAAALGQVVGDGRDPATTVGPLINSTQRERVERIMRETVEQGATVRVGGARKEGPGFFFQPTVVTDVKPGTPLHEEEVFGPVLPIIEFGSVGEVVEMANSSEYGLAAYVHTRDLATALTVSEQLDYGMVAVNDWYIATPEAPFGGMKQSGLGRESGSEGVYEYLETKTRFFGGIG